MTINDILQDVFSPILSITALIVSIRGNRTNTVNVLHSIQKLAIDKAKDCNGAFIKAIEDPNRTFRAIGMEPILKDDIEVVKEVLTSLAIIKDTVKTFKQGRKYEFFLRQFWVQISDDLQTHLGNFDNELFGDSAPKAIIKESMNRTLDGLKK